MNRNIYKAECLKHNCAKLEYIRFLSIQLNAVLSVLFSTHWMFLEVQQRSRFRLYSSYIIHFTVPIWSAKSPRQSKPIKSLTSDLQQRAQPSVLTGRELDQMVIFIGTYLGEGEELGFGSSYPVLTGGGESICKEWFN